MTKEELKNRTKKFALEVIKLIELIPNSKSGNTKGNQLIRSATSIASNYRAACRAKSSADFIYKITMVEEECDESLFWLELLSEANILKNVILTELLKEANELTAIFTSTAKTAKNNNLKPKNIYN